MNKGKIMIRLIAWMLIAGTVVLGGCNTMAGAGQDISKGVRRSRMRHKNPSKGAN